MWRTVVGAVLSFAGAAAGAYLGVLLFEWILTQNLYALVIPGTTLGLGCLLASPDRSRIRGIICAVAAVMVGYVAHWRNFYFEDRGESFLYFVQNITRVGVMTHVMVAVGTAMAFWWGRDNSPLISRFSKRKPRATES